MNIFTFFAIHNYEQTLLMKASKTAYRRYVLFLLTGVYTFAYIDRNLIVILQESIKEELLLTDTQLGFASGLAFSIFFLLLGLPVAHLADKYNRKKIMAIALAFWSVVTALTGRATNYIQLVIARMAVGAGETGGNPTSYSLIADYFPADKRGRAYGIYNSGVYIGILIGYLIGGYLLEHYSWRFAFYALGIPGVIFAILIYFTLKEPKREITPKLNNTKEEVPSIKEVFKYIFSQKVFVFLFLGVGIHTTIGVGFGNWTPSFFFRIHDMNAAQIGLWLSLVVGIGGIIGTNLGGYLVDKLGKRDKKWYILIPAFSALLGLPLTLTFVLVESKLIMLMAHILGVIIFATYVAPAYTYLQNNVPATMRGRSSAILAIALNIFGMGTGPILVGALNDLLEPIYGIYAIRWSLFFITFGKIIAFYFLWRAAKLLKQ